MKNRSWLTFAEYLMLVGSGVGSVATAASQQVIYTAAPISALLVLNLLNHRRLEQTAQETTATSISQLDQKFAGTVTALQQQMQALPSALHLANLRKDLQSRNQETYQELFQIVQQLQAEITRPELRQLPQDMARIQEQYASLGNSVAGVRESLSRLDTLGKYDSVTEEIEQLKIELAHLRTNLQSVGKDPKLNYYRVLQEQINQLNRRFNKLPAPFDASAMKQEMEALIKMVGEMVPRRDLARVEAQLERVAQHGNTVEQSIAPLRVVTNILKKQVDSVSNRVNLLEEQGSQSAGSTAAGQTADMVEALTATVDTLEQRINQLPDPADLDHLRSELQSLVSSHLGELQQQLDTVQLQAQDLDQQQQSLREWVNRLPQLLDSSALQNEVKYLATRVEWAESNVTDLQSQIATANNPRARYELVFDVKARRAAGETGEPIQAVIDRRERGQELRSEGLPASTVTAAMGSRTLLEQALQQAEARFILVYPFPSPEILDDGMMQQFRQFLDRNGCLDIGWGHLEETGPSPGPGGHHRFVSRSIDGRRTITPTGKGFLYTALNQLTDLKKQYPDRFRFKVLGTDESFLVCDRTFAILGAQSMATASVVFPETVIGLRTTDPEVIQRLVDRFDHPTLEPTDTIAYFNRAATRYDLGDRQGAIADYTQILTIHPTADVAYNNRGLARYDLGDKGGAIADFGEALRHNPNNSIACCNRGYVRSELGDKLGAIEDYTHALQLNPDYGPAYLYRGLARTRVQNKLGAIQDYTEVLRLNPAEASAYFYRGLAYARVGQQMEAVRDLRQAAQLFADQGDTTNYQQTVNAIKKLQKTLIVGGADHPTQANGHEAG